MKKAWLLAAVLPSCALAAGGIGGYAQQHLAYRATGHGPCAGLPACATMANEQRLQLHGEWQPGAGIGATLRTDAVHDRAVRTTRLVAREAYLDLTPSPEVSLRLGRQVITWGVGDYLFVNDIYPKNYDAFFTGKPFDHMKEAVDAVKLNALVGAIEAELVLARPRQDETPLRARFLAAATPPGMAVQAADRDGSDFALRVAGKMGRWDGALYVARYRAREPATVGVPGNALELELRPTRHVGASATGSVANGVVLAELAYVDTDLRAGNMNPYLFGRRLKALLGYATELGHDLSFSAQYHHEAELDYGRYLQSLAPMVEPARRAQQTVYLRLHKRLFHQTLGMGVQAFASFDGGKYVNSFASYSIADGLNLEAGFNWFGGPAASRYGMMHHDRNVYASLRYSF